jgi:glycosyltransferase involved in cell wall biosynthesis
MKILLVSGIFPPLVGGPSAQTQQIARGLLARGIEAHVITYGDPSSSGVIGGVPVTFIDGRRRRGLSDKVAQNLRLYRQLGRIIDEQNPSVIHMQTASGPLALLTGVAGYRRSVPTLLKYTADSTWETLYRGELKSQPLSRERYQKKLAVYVLAQVERLLFSIYRSVWATTPIFETRLIERYQVDPGKIFLLPNFIALQAFAACARERRPADSAAQTSPAELRLLTVTRLKPLKGVDVCLKAISLLSDLPVRLRVVGNGSPEYEAQLRDLTHSLRISDRVEFVGAVPHECLADEYRRADVFILASHEEAFGMVLLEAMAAGCSIVATRVGGIPAVVEDGISALLAPPGDAQSLASAIRHLAGDVDLRQRMAEAGRAQAGGFDLEEGLSALIGHYARLTI